MTSTTSPPPDDGPTSAPARGPGGTAPEAGTAPRPETSGKRPKSPGASPKSPGPTVPSSKAIRNTRAATAWFATAAALIVLVLLIILILQNTEMVTVHYLGFTGSIQMGTALLIAAVGGASLVTIIGIVRITQLRFVARRARRQQGVRNQ